MAGLQFNKIGFDRKENIWLFVCSEAVECVLVNWRPPYSDTSPKGECLPLLSIEISLNLRILLYP